MHTQRVPIQRLPSFSEDRSLAALQRYIDVAENNEMTRCFADTARVATFTFAHKFNF